MALKPARVAPDPWLMIRRSLARSILIAWCLTAAVCSLAQQPTLQVSAASVTFTAISGGPTPPSQSLNVVSVDGSPLNVATLVDGGAAGTPAPSWLVVTPSLGAVPIEIRLSINQTGLNVGAYSARIQLTDSQGHLLAPIIPVSLEVVTGSPQWDVSPAEVVLSGSLSAGRLQQGILVRNLGPSSISPVSATVTSGAPWLTTSVGSCDTVCVVTITAILGALTPGPYLGTVLITTALGSQSIPVSLFVAGEAPFLQLSAEAAQFEAIQGSGVSDSQIVALLNEGVAQSSWSASIVAGAQWLSVSPASGVIAPGQLANLTLTMAAGGLIAGNYGGMIRIDSGAGSLYLPVNLQVEAPGTASAPLTSPPGGLVFTSQTGATSAQQQISLWAPSPSPLSFQASAQTSNWLSITPTTGQVSSSSTSMISASAATVGLAAGFYSGLINIAFGTTAMRTLHAGFSITQTAVTSCLPQNLYLTETAVPDGFAAQTGFAEQFDAVVFDDCGNAVSDAVVTASFSSGDPGITLQSIGDGYYSATWIPANSSGSLPGGAMTIALRAFAPPLNAAFSEVIGTVAAAATTPVIALGGILSNSFPLIGAPLAPGAVVQIYGSGFGSGPTPGVVANGQLSTALGGVSVQIAGINAPLYYVSSGQINAEVPAELQPNSQYQVIVDVNGVYSNSELINIASVQPGIATASDGTALAQNSNYQLITSSNPAHAGNVIILYLTGMGATNPSVATGAVAPGAPPAQTVIQPQVTVGGVAANVVFSGLSPGSIGLYQIDVTVPAGLSSGDLPVVVVQNGVTSNTATLPVQ